MLLFTKLVARLSWKIFLLMILPTVAVAVAAAAAPGGEGERTLVYNTAVSGEQPTLVSRQDATTTVDKLAVTEDDIHYHGIAVAGDTGDVYFTTSAGEIRKASATTSEENGDRSWGITTILSGRVRVRVTGYNLGTTVEDIIMLTIRGVECSTFRRESSNSLVCLSGHPALTTDQGQGITADDIAIQTRIGGWTGGGYPGDFVESALADHSLKPIITGVKSWSREISPHALALDHSTGHLYYSDILARSIERVRIDAAGGDTAAVVQWTPFLEDVGHVFGMACDPEDGKQGGFLYFSDAEGGTVSRVELLLLLSGDNIENLTGRNELVETIVSGVVDPMGVALEPDGARVFYTLRGGSIRAAARNGMDNVGGNAYMNTAGSKDALSDYEVRRFDSGTRLDGIAIATTDSEGAGDDPTELKLYWSEHGRAAALERSTLAGTGVEKLVVMSAGPGKPFTDGVGAHATGQLVWPRSLAFGAGPSSGLIFSEHLGAIRLLSDPAGGVVPDTIAEEQYPAAVALDTLKWGAAKEGLGDKYFTEIMR